MSRQPYPSDLTDAQWERIEPHVPKPKPGGRPASVERREIVNAICYLVREGITWRAMPHDFPDYRTVYHYFRIWRDDGTWQAIHDALRDDVRTTAGREASPSAAILDAQSVKTVEQAATCRGYDGGKRVKGRKRHLVVDTLGFGCPLGDGRGRHGRQHQRPLRGTTRGRWPARPLRPAGDAVCRHWLRTLGGWTLEIVHGVGDREGRQVEPKRWIVERTFGWLNRYRRLSKDDAELPETREVIILIAMTHLMARRVRK